MNDFKGQTLSWQIVNGAIELALHRDPCNEIGSLTLDELEKFAAASAAKIQAHSPRACAEGMAKAALFAWDEQEFVAAKV